MGLNLTSIRKIVNNQLEKHVSYNTLKYFVQHDEELLPLWKTQRVTRIVDTQMSLEASKPTTDKVII